MSVFTVVCPPSMAAANASSLPQLDCAQLTKLKHLTMISLAAVNHTIPYSTLLTQLDISDLRELEVYIYT